LSTPFSTRNRIWSVGLTLCLLIVPLMISGTGSSTRLSPLKTLNTSNDIANDATSSTTCTSTGKGQANVVPGPLTGNITIFGLVGAKTNNTAKGFVISVVVSSTNTIPTPGTPCGVSDTQVTFQRILQPGYANAPIYFGLNAVFNGILGTPYAIYLGENCLASNCLVTVFGRVGGGPQTTFILILQ
jgi:hypothetical protein